MIPKRRSRECEMEMDRYANKVIYVWVYFQSLARQLDLTLEQPIED